MGRVVNGDSFLGMLADACTWLKLLPSLLRVRH
jgi:hypothetical protein